MIHNSISILLCFKSVKKQLKVHVLSLDGRRVTSRFDFRNRTNDILPPKAVSWTYVDRTVQK